MTLSMRSRSRKRGHGYSKAIKNDSRVVQSRSFKNQDISDCISYFSMHRYFPLYCSIELESLTIATCLSTSDLTGKITKTIKNLKSSRRQEPLTRIRLHVKCMCFGKGSPFKQNGSGHCNSWIQQLTDTRSGQGTGLMFNFISCAETPKSLHWTVH